MHWKTSLAALLIATTFGVTASGLPSWAAASEKEQLDKAGADVGAGKYKEGAAEFKALADKGNPFAQCIMGVMSQNGRGVTKDIHQAINWYMKSANQGFAGAEEHLGEIYRDGTDGIKKDTKLAANWFRRAAFHGDGKAQLALGKMFMASHQPHESTEAKIATALLFGLPKLASKIFSRQQQSYDTGAKQSGRPDPRKSRERDERSIPRLMPSRRCRRCKPL